MLFMGEEYGARTPWQFFTDHDDPEIAAATSRGRAEEFAAHGWGDEVPDPQEESTFTNSTLDWSELDDTEGESALLLDWYRTLIRLRRDEQALAADDLGTTWVERRGKGSSSVVVVHRGDLRVVVNLSDEPVTEAGEVVAAWHTVDVREGRDGSGSSVVIPTDSVVLLR